MPRNVDFLIVVDMQNDFVSGALGSEMARAIVPEAVEKVRSFVVEGGAERLIFTKDTHGENYAETNEGRHLPVPHCVKGTWGFEIIDELAGFAKDAKIIEKPAFGSTLLPSAVREMTDAPDEEISFYLLGLCTDICVVSNATILKAHFPESCVNVYSKCCAGVTRESHDAALLTMKMCQIELL